ncbi:hypothetical protein GO755_38515 [Spirosoma sp. HMF4905]|uniref:Uncharacterized protein n=1 Tax=Spirosoma arboris TaxID=2682092 RepID=A0A7K1SQA4_9BACT|nr:hypothetical protein [Spirosoma arboris]MVM35971.1 hypothetical protein [Spirosoma arboris]
MKNTLRSQLGYWLILTSFSLTPSMGQPLPFEDANVIFITTDLADKQAYQAISQVLTEHSILFSLASDGMLISTKGNPSLSSQGAFFMGQVSVIGGLVKLTGRMHLSSEIDSSGSSERNITPIRYHTGKSTLAKAGFMYLDGLAHKLRPVLHGVIRYKVQKDPQRVDTF